MQKVLVIGAGPIKIGHACEFDYSGTQICSTLKNEGIYTILVNSNPATFMTSEGVADKTYLEPLTVETVLKILEKDHPDAIAVFAGGQVALNLALKLEGYKDKLKFIGTGINCIRNSEDRMRFHEILQNNDIDFLKGFLVKRNEKINSERFPVILRTSYSLGGSSSCIVDSYQDCLDICNNIWGQDNSAQIYAEECVDGWAEYELEVVKDKTGECCVVCCIENIDPMGIHTGDSISVSPCQTILPEDFFRMRAMSYRVAKAIDLEAGSFNVQFAKCHKTGRLVMIEVNARLSRSSALASKATGIPIAVVATKLALGYSMQTLKEKFNFKEFDIYKKTDSVAVKLPIFQFEKLGCENRFLKTYMQSVGEIMGIEKNFKCALLKAMEGGYVSSDDLFNFQNQTKKELYELISKKYYARLLVIFELLRRGESVSSISQLSKIDPYFISQIFEIVCIEKKVKHLSLQTLKQSGFSDRYIGNLLKMSEKEVFVKRQNIKPRYGSINKLQYFYSSYSGANEKVERLDSDKKNILIIGSGPNKIGQGLEFDYCCVHAGLAVRKGGYNSIIVNCNPATVSTDYNMSTRLYFEPISLEYVMNIVKRENIEGVFLQFGGQDAIKLAKNLDEFGVRILGTSYKSIDIAEKKSKFRDFLNQCSIDQPKNEIVSNFSSAMNFTDVVGYPVILRPSYVIGGTQISKVNNQQELESYFNKSKENNDILIEEFIEDAIEVDVDAICDGERVNICGIMQQIEPSGIHSGDSCCITPPYSLGEDVLQTISVYTKKMGLELGIIGLFNVQFIINNKQVFVIELNPRASRTIPFVSKFFGVNFVKECVDICLKNHKLEEESYGNKYGFALKKPVFSFIPFSKKKRGVEMCSTGEEMFLSSSWEKLIANYHDK